MAIPSGSGTEVLKRAYVNTLSSTDTAIITGVANHIYTILSVSFSEFNNADELIKMYVDYDAGGTDIYLFTHQTLNAYETFVWNDKFVMSGTDKLWVGITGSSSLIDVYVSYIDQDWT